MTPTDEIVLNEDQDQAVGTILTSRVTLLSGAGGVGKSVVVREITRGVRALVLAPTGVAAINANGSTIHAALRMNFAVKDPANDTANFGFMPPYLSSRIREAEMLVIDEISMVRADMLDAIDRRLRTVRGVEEPFGGLLTVLSGDCYQLPPVLARKGGEKDAYVKSGLWRSEWWFDSQVVRDLMGRRGMSLATLRTPMRQADPDFVTALQRARVGKLRAQDLDLFNSRVVSRTPAESNKLVPLRSTAAEINAGHLDSLDAPEYTYHRQVAYRSREVSWRSGEDSPPVQVRLKAGTLVSMTCNSYRGTGAAKELMWANGHLGKIVEADEAGVSVEMFHSGETHRLIGSLSPGEVDWGDALARMDGLSQYVYDLKGQATLKRVVSAVDAIAFQIPVAVAAAQTIHRAQGLTLPKVHLAGDFSWLPGLAYVGVSRVRALEDLSLDNPLTVSDFGRIEKVQRFVSELKEMTDG